MTIPTLSTLPVAPARTDPPATFVTLADAFLAAIVTFQGEMNTSIGAMNTDIAQVNTDATAAAASATAAANASNASAWVSGTTYALGDVVYSPVDYQSYRRIVAGAGTTDPSADATNWTKISAEPLPTQTGNAGNYLTTDGTTASWAAVEALPSQTGNAGLYLTTDGTDTSWGEVSAAPSLEATASGSLANGDTVIINADGTVSVVVQTINPTPSLGSAVVYETGNSYFNSAVFDSNSNKIVIAYQDNTNSSYGTAVVGTVSGESISFGTAVVWQSSAVYRVAIAFDSITNTVIIGAQDTSGTTRIKGYVGTVSGTSISFGVGVSLATQNTDQMSVTFDSSSNKVVFVHDSGTPNYHGVATVGTVSGTTILVGSAVTFSASYTAWMDSTFDSNSNKVIIAYRDGLSNYGAVKVGTVSGTSISFGSAVVFSSATSNQISINFDSNLNKVVIGYQNGGNSNYGTAIVGTVSGTSISFGSPTVFQTTDSRYIRCEFDSTNKKMIIAYNDDSTNYGKVVVGTVSGTSISFGTPLNFYTGGATYIGLAFDSVAQRSVIAYRDFSGGGAGTAIVFKSQTSTTTLTEENYIGISDGAYSDATTANIQIIGSVDDAQSGLTAGQKYYVQQDGTLAETPDDPSVFAGTAVSATKLIVKG